MTTTVDNPKTLTGQARADYIVQAIDNGRKAPEIGAELGMGRGQVYNIYKRETGQNAGTVETQSPEPVNDNSTSTALQPMDREASVLQELAGCAETTACKLRDDLPFARWSELVRSLTVMVDACPWWLGDALIFGERKYGQTYAQVAEVTGKAIHTLQNSAWVASRIPPSRRREDLSFSHHAEVAGMEPDIADAYLNLAEEHGWTRNELRRSIAEARRQEALEKLEADASARARALPPSRPSAPCAGPERLDHFREPAQMVEEAPAVLPPIRLTAIQERPVKYAEEEALPPSSVELAVAVVDAARFVVADFTDRAAQERLKNAVVLYDDWTGKR